MNALDNYYKSSLLAGLCGEYKNMWQGARHDKGKLISLAMSQQSIPHLATFAYEGKGMTKECFKEEFADYINGTVIKNSDGVEGYTYALYVDYDYDNEILVDKDVIHVMWTNDAILSVPTSKCPIIYISNKSKVSLSCEGFNTVKVYLFDESEIELYDVDETCTVTVLKYSDNTKVTRGKYCFSDDIHCFAKELKL